MAWLSQISGDTAFFPQIAVPLAMLGTGIGIAFTPLTSAGIAGVAPGDAGAASGLVNVAQQLGGSLGLGILVTVFSAANGSGASSALQARDDLAHAIGMALTGSAVFLALALGVVLLVMRRPAPAAGVAQVVSNVAS
jgi:hypothetical protein